MNLKTATLIAMIGTTLQVFIVVGVFLIPSWHYSVNSNIFVRLVNLAFYASLALFFFTLYSKQQKG